MDNSEKIAVVAISGGADSTTLLYQIVKEKLYGKIYGLSFSYGSKHNDYEIPCAEKTCKKLGVEHNIINLEFINKHFDSHLLKSGGKIPEGHYTLDSQKQTIVPFRNGIILSIAAGFAESKKAKYVYIASHAGDVQYPDCLEAFNKPMFEAIKNGTLIGVEIKPAFQNITKAEIFKLGLKLGVDYRDTWSCYNPTPEGLRDGRCGTCVEALESLWLNGVRNLKDYGYADVEYFKKECKITGD